MALGSRSSLVPSPEAVPARTSAPILSRTVTPASGSPFATAGPTSTAPASSNMPYTSLRGIAQPCPGAAEATLPIPPISSTMAQAPVAEPQISTNLQPTASSSANNSFNISIGSLIIQVSSSMPGQTSTPASEANPAPLLALSPTASSSVPSLSISVPSMAGQVSSATPPSISFGHHQLIAASRTPNRTHNAPISTTALTLSTSVSGMQENDSGPNRLGASTSPVSSPSSPTSVNSWTSTELQEANRLAGEVERLVGCNDIVYVTTRGTTSDSDVEMHDASLR
ncbi:hypothetical protein FRB90_009639 [Tulasnella sp. 427]|nr:hypothetical protein FRB90_009639 [Tulasnella sp. 427]